MKKREKKMSELEIIKILNARAIVAVHICTVTVATVHFSTVLHPLMWVFFCTECVKSVSFFILHNFAQTDVIALSDLYIAFSKKGDLYIYLYMNIIKFM